jgi:hypothetical protein
MLTKLLFAVISLHVSQIAMASEFYKLECTYHNPIGRHLTADFDHETSTLELSFEKSSTQIAEVLDVFAVPPSDVNRFNTYLVRVKFKPESCKVPSSPYAIGGVTCNAVESAELLASSESHWNVKWEKRYTASTNKIILQISQKQKTHESGIKYQMFKVSLSANAQRYDANFGNICESDCGRNGMLIAPVKLPDGGCDAPGRL